MSDTAPSQPLPPVLESAGLLDKAGPLVVGLTAAFYASGYTVILTAAQRLGINDPGSGIFKGKYIQVGAYCVGFILTAGGIGYLASTKSRHPPPINSPQPPWSRLLSPLMILVGLLSQSFLAWPSSSSVVLLSAMILYFLLVTVASLNGWLVRPWLGPAVTVVLAMLAALIVVCCGVMRFLDGLAKNKALKFLQTLPTPQGQEALSLMLLIFLCVFLGRVFYVLVFHFIHDDRDMRWFWCALTVPMLAFGSYDAVIGFAVVVYPYIPSEKGGGDYQVVSTAVFYGKDGKPLCPTSDPVVVLLETDTCFYVTRDMGERARERWGKLGSDSLESIYQISQESIDRITYVPPTSFRQRAKMEAGK